MRLPLHLPFLLRTIVLTSLVGVTNAYAITGAQGGVDATTGQRPSRQEISSFRYAGAIFDLYILALQDLTQQDQTSLLSYYQVAGLSALLLFILACLVCLQASMVILLPHGMASRGHMRRVIALMGLFFFQRGTALISRSSRYVNP